MTRSRRGELPEMLVKILLVVAALLVALLIIGLIAKRLMNAPLPW